MGHLLWSRYPLVPLVSRFTIMGDLPSIIQKKKKSLGREPFNFVATSNLFLSKNIQLNVLKSLTHIRNHQNPWMSGEGAGLHTSN